MGEVLWLSVIRSCYSLLCLYSSSVCTVDVVAVYSQYLF